MDQLEEYACPMETQMQVRLAMEEIFVNIANYAYHPEVGEVEVRYDVTNDPLLLTIQFLDSGVPFNPLAKEDADTSEEALMEREGGLGIYLVKNLMDDVRYAYEDGKNVLTMTKRIG